MNNYKWYGNSITALVFSVLLLSSNLGCKNLSGEPFSVSDDHVFNSIGSENVMTTTRSGANQVDYFKVDVVAGDTYVVEVFDVDSSLTFSKDDFGHCQNDNYPLTGLGVIIHNEDGEVVAKQCEPLGSGNVHNLVQFEAQSSGGYYIGVVHNDFDSSDAGRFSLRVLPHHDDAMADWDENYEPNNERASAYLLNVGVDNAITTQIASKNTLYATNHADVDWYRVQPEANASYVVEVFDVDSNLSQTEGDYDFCKSIYTANSGLAIEIFDSNGAVIAHQCETSGSGNVHNLVRFSAISDATHYIRVINNDYDSTTTGRYSIRVLPHYSDQAAVWDENFEPNNDRATAYLLDIGIENAVTTNIASRNELFSTSYADIDWYRIQPVANTSYVLEVYDVDGNLSQSVGDYDFCEKRYTEHTGLAVQVFDSNGAVISQQCEPNGVGEVHNTLEFIATTSETYYVQVQHNNYAAQDSGVYSLRIISK